MKRNLNLDPDLETLVSSPGVGVRTGPYIPLYSQPQWVLPRAANDPSVFTVTKKWTIKTLMLSRPKHSK